MGEIILNGRSYNSGTKYLEVTQAQYNALPASKLTDGTLYCITDAPGPGEGFPPMIYSYEEREVGVWIDGKPLYQKTIILDSLITDGNWNSVAHNISNVEKFVKIDSVAFRNIEDTNFIYMPVPTRNETANIDFNIGLRVNLTNIDYIIVRYSTEIENIIVNLQYTKTTDTAGAGTWLPDGTQAHHYSTDEHVIGTWIDGKTLYERTFVTNADTSGINDGSWTVLQIPEHPQDIGAILAGNVGAMNYSTYSMYRFSYDLTNKKITVAALRNATMSTGTNVTLQYIKITD